MRQVPLYLIIGNGRVAKHFQQYFSLLNIAYLTWHRNQSETELQQALHKATHILILISDHAIQNFHDRYLQKSSAIKIHCSGSLYFPDIYGAHPLMTFNQTLYTLPQYLAFNFVIDQDAPDFKILFPHLENKYARLSQELKMHYHALCVLSGNLMGFVWQQLFSRFEKQFNLPKEFAHPYLMQQTENLIQNPHLALTGPLVRGDQTVIANHLHALTGDVLQSLYASFVECYQRDEEIKK